jgi:hypothetical protein
MPPSAAPKQSTTWGFHATTDRHMRDKPRHISSECCKNATTMQHRISADWLGRPMRRMASVASGRPQNLSRDGASIIRSKAPEGGEAFGFLALRIQSPRDLEPGSEVRFNPGLCPGNGFGRGLTMHRRRGGFAGTQDAPVGLGLLQLYFQRRYSFAACRGVGRNRPNRHAGQRRHRATCEG